MPDVGTFSGRYSGTAVRRYRDHRQRVNTEQNFLSRVNNKKVETDCAATAGGKGKQTYLMASVGGSTVNW